MLKNQIYVDKLLRISLFQDWMTPTCFQEAVDRAVKNHPMILHELDRYMEEGIEDGYDPEYLVLLSELHAKFPIMLN